jgi:hypothetical protein
MFASRPYQTLNRFMRVGARIPDATPVALERAQK